ncbi:MAG: SWIM zinc finger family protein [Aeropyrum sp.]|nr:SWIM zinc finger family protein [Aeropyrum sp.]
MRDACPAYMELREDEVLGSSMRYVRVDHGSSSIWVYIGDREDYVLLEGLYCSCPSFAASLRKGGWGCKHLAGLKAAVRLGRFRSVEATPSEAVEMAVEAISAGIAVSLRRRLARGG